MRTLYSEKNYLKREEDVGAILENWSAWDLSDDGQG